MTHIVKKTVYKLLDNNRTCGFEITVSDEGVEIDTNAGLDIHDFIKSMQEILTMLTNEYGDLE